MKIPALPQSPEFQGLPQDLLSRISAAVSLAHEAGLQTLERFQSATLQAEIKSDDSPVTEADRAAEILLRGRIVSAFPQDALLGEEHGEKTGTSGWRWILDPIDGTVNFIQGVPLYGTLVGLEHNGQPVGGVIFIPGLSEMVFAAKGGGAWWVRGDAMPVPARVSRATALKDAVVCFTSTTVFQRAGKTQALLSLTQHAKQLRGYPDAYGYLLVATGRADAMLDPLMHVWDNAPLLPVLQEAGGKFSDWAGHETITGDTALGTNGILHGEVLKALHTPLPKASPLATALGALVFGGLVGLGLGLVVRSKPAPAPAPTVLEDQVLRAIGANTGWKVEYTDALGDGDAAWDRGPLFPTTSVNCETWLQTVLADAYSVTGSSRQSVMNLLRYYGGVQSFATRKHYPLHAVTHDPGPLKAIAVDACAPSSETVTLGFETFKKSAGFACPLFRETATPETFSYVPREGIANCLNSRLSTSGPLVVYAVPTARYLEKYGKTTGPMGLVHGLLLTRGDRGWTVHHASITSHKVEAALLEDYVKANSSLHKGYALYELDPNWSATSAPEIPEAKALATCEETLVKSGRHRTTDFR